MFTQHGFKEIKEDHPNENKQRLFIQSLLEEGSQPLALAFGRNSKAGSVGRRLL